MTNVAILGSRRKAQLQTDFSPMEGWQIREKKDKESAQSSQVSSNKYLLSICHAIDAMLDAGNKKVS